MLDKIINLLNISLAKTKIIVDKIINLLKIFFVKTKLEDFLKYFEEKKDIEYLSGIEPILHSKPRLGIWLIPLVITLFIISIIIWLSISATDVISSSTGTIVTSLRTQDIQPKEVGIVKKILVKEGEKVALGQKLVEFESEIEELEYKKLLSQYINQSLKLAGLNLYKSFLEKNNKNLDISKYLRLNLEQEFIQDTKSNLIELEQSFLNSKIASYRQELLTLKNKYDKSRIVYKNSVNELKKQEEIVNFLKDKVTNYDTLVNEDLESNFALQEQQNELQKAKSDFKIKNQNKNQSRIDYKLALRELELFEVNVLKETLTEIKAIEDELPSIRVELNKTQNQLSLKTLSSPVDGYVYNLQAFTKGGVIQSGDLVMQIVPLNTNLEVLVDILNKDIGFINIGQEVKVKVDSFEFTKYGYINGKVKHIENAAIKDEQKGEIYKAIVSFDKDYIMVNNKKVLLVPGMTAIVDIKTTTRNMIDYIISPVLRYKDEALTER